MRRSIALSAAVFAALAVLVPSAASAATITVNTTVGASTPGVCTLREAILSANNDVNFGTCAAGSGADRIVFALPTPSTIALATELPEIKGNLEIAGPGSTALTVSGSSAVRPFLVGGPNTKISGLTITEGKSTFGGGLVVNSSGQLELLHVVVTENQALASGGANAFANGGGIYNQGALTLVESVVEQNLAKASGASSQIGSTGGGIENTSSSKELVLVRSTVRDNESISISASAVGTNANGGGIGNFGKVVIRDSTINGNLVSGSGSTSNNGAAGGGLENANSGTVKVTIEGSTFVGNEAKASGTNPSTTGGAIAIYTPFTITSSTIASNSAANGANLRVAAGAEVSSTIVAKPLNGGSCSMPLVSLGYNLEETSGCGMTTATDQHGVNPQLGPLDSNGGPTATMAIPITSPAIDRGLSPATETTDQRGLRRPVDVFSVANAAGGNGADVGAYEFQLPLAEITRGPAQGATIVDAEPSFEFRADEAGASFLCALDGAPLAACTSPFKAPRLADGAHTFGVVAVAASGLREATPVSRSFTVDTRSRLVPVKPIAPGKPAVRPQGKITGLPGKTTKRRLKIRFSSSVAGSSFTCKLDKRKWRSCRSPYKTPQLELGKHVFKLRATGPTGLADRTPAVKKFEVVAPKPKRRS